MPTPVLDLTALRFIIGDESLNIMLDLYHPLSIGYTRGNLDVNFAASTYVLYGPVIVELLSILESAEQSNNRLESLVSGLESAGLRIATKLTMSYKGLAGG